MERLPLRDAARMSILSHKWQDIWNSTQQLVFDDQFFSTVLHGKQHWELHHLYYALVSKILFHHRSTILKFSLFVPSSLKECPDVSEWIAFLARSGIRNFSIGNQSKMHLRLHSHLFSCKELEELNLRRCEINPPPNFRGFRKLVSLKLLNVVFKQGSFENLMAGCLALKTLSLINCKGIENVINVYSPNLKHLVVAGSFKSPCLKSVENLLSASICLMILPKGFNKTSFRALIEVFSNSSEFKKISFGGHFCEAIFNGWSAPTTCRNITVLGLTSIFLTGPDDFSCAVRAMQSCPNIEKLNISVVKSDQVDKQILGDDLMSFRFHKLRVIDAKLKRGLDIELQLMEFLLASSPMLATFSLEIDNIKDTTAKSRIFMKLRQFDKASQNIIMMIYMTDQGVTLRNIDYIYSNPTTLDSGSGSGSGSDLGSDFDSDSDSDFYQRESDEEFEMSDDDFI